MTFRICLLKYIFNLIENEDQKGAYPILYDALFLSEKMPLKQAELFTRSMVNILLSELRANSDSKSFEWKF